MSTQKREDLRLHRAAMRKNPKELKDLLETGLEDFRAEGRRNKDKKFAGKTAWDIAVEKNRSESVKLLLGAGAGPELGEALLTAASHGSNDVVETLVDMGSDLTINNWIGENMLHIAMFHCRYETVKKLLNAGMDVSTRGPRGSTALHMAAEYGRINLLKLLLEKGSDVNTTDDNGQTALFLAALVYADEVWDDRIEFIQQLLTAGSDVRAIDNEGQTPLHRASIVRFFENSPDQPYVDAEVVELLLRAGSDVSIRDNKGRIALHAAAFECDDTWEVLELLLEAGSDVTARDHEGQTALHKAGLAVFKGFDNGESNEAIELLLQYGSDVNCRDFKGRTALNLASSAGQVKVVRALLNSGSVGQRDRQEALQAAETAKSNHEIPVQNSQTLVKLLEENK